MPYLPIDPADLGRSYEAVIRVNSQSGKGGIAYLLEREYGLALPRRLQIEFSQVVQAVMDATGKELTAADLHALFEREYVAARRSRSPASISSKRARRRAGRPRAADRATFGRTASRRSLEGAGNGPVDAFVQALRAGLGLDIHVLDYHEHATGTGRGRTAVAYVQLRVGGAVLRRRYRSQHRHGDAEGRRRRAARNRGLRAAASSPSARCRASRYADRSVQPRRNAWRTI